MTEAQEQAAVRRGVRLLDAVEPKWFKKINPANFNLESTDYCVLGQTYGEYFKGLKSLAEKAIIGKAGRLKLTNDSRTIEVSGDYYGFSPDSNAASERMGQQWLRAVRYRRSR